MSSHKTQFEPLADDVLIWVSEPVEVPATPAQTMDSFLFLDEVPEATADSPKRPDDFDGFGGPQSGDVFGAFNGTVRDQTPATAKSHEDWIVIETVDQWFTPAAMDDVIL